MVGDSSSKHRERLAAGTTSSAASCNTTLLELASPKTRFGDSFGVPDGTLLEIDQVCGWGPIDWWLRMGIDAVQKEQQDPGEIAKRTRSIGVLWACGTADHSEFSLFLLVRNPEGWKGESSHWNPRG
jgi:hypothetical protein